MRPLTSLALLALALPASAVPLQLSHQGRLMDDTGLPLDGAHDLDVALFDTTSGGTALWSEALTVDFDDGYFHVTLGADSTNALQDDHFPGDVLWLELAVDAGTPLDRLPIYSVPYAIKANALVGGLSWDDLQDVPSELSDGDADTLAAMTCSSAGELLTWDGTGWGCSTPSTAHTHSAAEVDSGVLDIARLPIGSGSAEVAPGDHLHAASTLTGQIGPGQLPIGPGSTQVAAGDHTHAAADADTLDGQDSTDFAGASHSHAPGDADTLDGQDSSDFAASGHSHSVAFSDLTGAAVVAQLPVGTSASHVAAGDHSHTAFTADIDLNNNQLVNASVQNAGSAPYTCNASTAGALYFDTGDNSFYGCNGSGWTSFAQPKGTTANPGIDCADVLASGVTADGPYWIDPDGAGGLSAWQAYCDMTTDGGGWTIVYAATGANGEQPLVSNTAASGDPLAFAHYNVSRAHKIALSAISNESLFKRNNNTWIKTDHEMFDSSLTGSNQHGHYSVTVTANNGTSAGGFMGWSNYNMSAGGDFNVSMVDGGTCSGNTSSGVDHHSGGYYHLNCGCQRQYLYSYSAGSGDGDAGYDVNTGLGTWAGTATCDSAEGGSLRFFAAMR